MEVYNISKGPKSKNDMKLLYINGEVDENSWLRRQNLNYYKLNFFLDDVAADIIIGEKLWLPSKYSVLLYPPFVEHYGKLHGVQKVEYFELLIPPDFFNFFENGNEILSFIYEGMKFHCIKPSVKGRESLIEAFNKLKKDADALEKNIYQISTVIDILRIISNEVSAYTEIENTDNISKNLAIVLDYINQNYKTISNLEDISRNTYFSKSYICRLFKNEFGCSPYKYLSDKKLGYAMELILNGATVTDACFASGYNNCSVFIEAFKKKFGFTPAKCK